MADCVAGGFARTFETIFRDSGRNSSGATAIVVPPNITPSARRLSPAAACQPSTLVVEFVEPEADFVVASATPQTVTLLVKDNCGQAASGAQGGVNFSNKDKALTLFADSNGMATGTWTPGSLGNVTVGIAFITSSTSSFSTSGTSALSGSIAKPGGPSAPLPSVVQNSASYQFPPTSFAPGSWVSVFGDSLSDSTTTSDNPYPSQLGGAQILLGSSPLPLHYVSGAQVNALIPYGLAPNTIHSLYVVRDNTISVPIPLPVATAQPGIFTVDQSGTGQGVIVNGVTNVLADSNAPVTAGDVVTIYCTGLGEVANEPMNGMPAPSSPLATTLVNPAVTIGNLSAVVMFSGLTPEAIGLYQVNAQVPAGVSSGDAVPVVISVTDASSNTASSNTVTIAVQ